MPRMDPLNKKNLSPEHLRTDRQEPITQFLRHLFFPTKQLSEPSIVNELLEAISSVWDKTIVPTLLLEFGNTNTLYAIFYTGESPDEIVLEVWDPKYSESKPSQVFILNGIPNIAKYLPKNRSNAEIMTLDKWY
jgi:hypothetical protein